MFFMLIFDLNIHNSFYRTNLEPQIYFPPSLIWYSAELGWNLFRLFLFLNNIKMNTKALKNVYFYPLEMGSITSREL